MNDSDFWTIFLVGAFMGFVTGAAFTKYYVETHREPVAFERCAP